MWLFSDFCSSLPLCGLSDFLTFTLTLVLLHSCTQFVPLGRPVTVRSQQPQQTQISSVRCMRVVSGCSDLEASRPFPHLRSAHTAIVVPTGEVSIPLHPCAVAHTQSLNPCAAYPPHPCPVFAFFLPVPLVPLVPLHMAAPAVALGFVSAFSPAILLVPFLCGPHS